MTDRSTTILVQHTKHFYHLAMLSALFGVLVTTTAGKTLDLFGTPYSITIFYFPFIYVIGDILTEVYGFALARRALWYLTIARVIMIVLLGLIALAPSAASMKNSTAYDIVFSQAPYIALVQIASTFAGDIFNNYIVAKLKVACSGRHMSLRFVLSTLGSELVNSFIFYFFALGLTGIIPMSIILSSIIGATLLKSLIEILVLPISLPLARKLKKIEGIDFYDRGTDFNPLKF